MNQNKSLQQINRIDLIYIVNWAGLPFDVYLLSFSMLFFVVSCSLSSHTVSFSHSL